MKFRSVLLSVLAGSICLSACSPEQINQVSAIATQLASQLQDGNKATIDLQGIASDGQTLAYGESDVESVQVNGRPIKFNFNAEGLLEIDELDLSQGGTAEAEIKIKEMDQPIQLEIDPQGQLREDIRLRARIPFAQEGNRRVFLDNQADVERNDLTEEERIAKYRKRAVVINLGPVAAEKIKDKKVMGAWLDGDRLPLNHFKLANDGKLLIDAKAFAHIFFALKADPDRQIKAESLRESPAFEQKKEVLRKRIMENKEKYTRTRTETTTTTTTTTESSFEVQQVRRPQQPRPNERVGQPPFPQQAAQRQQQRLPIRIGDKELSPQEASGLRGVVAAKLAQENQIFKNRTLYLLVENEQGAMQLHKFVISGDKLKIIAQNLQERVAKLQERLAAIKERFKEAQGEPQEVLESIGAEIEAAEEEINADGGLEIEVESEESFEVEEGTDVEDIVEKEEIETELTEELNEDSVEVDVSNEEFAEVESTTGESEAVVVAPEDVEVETILNI